MYFPVETKFKKLFEPLKVNQMYLRNRIILGPLGDSDVKSETLVGMIMKGSAGNLVGGKSRMGLAGGATGFDDVAYLKRLREEASLYHTRGAKAEVEVLHCGQFAKPADGKYVYGSVGFIREDGIEVRALDEESMALVISQYVESSLIAKDIGYDCVMLHFAHGWLPSQFLSPMFNSRTDEYGGSLENRMKFPLRICEAIRKAVGPDYPLDMRISACEYHEGSIDPQDVVEFLKKAQKYIDMVSISGGTFFPITGNPHTCSTSLQPHMLLTGWSEKIKEALKIPVAVVGAIMTPDEAEEVISSGKADAVVIGRASIADPLWAQKALENRSEDIVPCLRCLQCWNRMTYDGVIDRKEYGMFFCPANPRQSRGSRVAKTLTPAEKPKNVMIIGGGPAGMNAALTASQRGHKVTLFEKSVELGGLLNCAHEDDIYKLDLVRFRNYLIRQVKKSEVEIRYNTEVTPELIKEQNPDVLILAVGAKPKALNIPGALGETVLQATDAYKDIERCGKNVVIIGGGATGCELALLLKEKGRTVTIVEAGEDICATSNPFFGMIMEQKLEELGVEVRLGSTCQEISGKEATIVSGNTKEQIACETVVMSVGFRPDYDYINSFYNILHDTSTIGDCVAPRTMLRALEDGYFIGTSI